MRYDQDVLLVKPCDMFEGLIFARMAVTEYFNNGAQVYEKILGNNCTVSEQDHPIVLCKSYCVRGLDFVPKSRFDIFTQGTVYYASTCNCGLLWAEFLLNYSIIIGHGGASAKA